MTVPVYQRAALLLVVVGQAVGAFGLPVPAGSRLAACGCRAEDRAAGQCCCIVPAASGCCPVEPEPAAGCCRSAAKAKVGWVGGVLQQKCRGPLDAEPAPATQPTVAPDGSSVLRAAEPDECLLAALSPIPSGPCLAPDSPPPRPFAV